MDGVRHDGITCLELIALTVVCCLVILIVAYLAGPRIAEMLAPVIRVLEAGGLT